MFMGHYLQKQTLGLIFLWPGILCLFLKNYQMSKTARAKHLWLGVCVIWLLLMALPIATLVTYDQNFRNGKIAS